MEKSIKEYIVEKLSDANKEKILSLLDRINDRDFDKIYNTISSVVCVSDDGFMSRIKEFVRNHGLDTIDFGRNGSTEKTLVDIFGSNNHIDILEKIVDNNGVIGIDQLLSKRTPENGTKLNNIFDIAKNCEFGDWSDEAITLALMVNRKGSTAIGMFEILLQFMLKEGCNPKAGDVGLNDGRTLEVKGVTKSERGTYSGGHVAGQTTKGNIGPCKDIYKYIDKNAFDGKYGYGDTDYFQGRPNGYSTLLERAKESRLSDKDILETVFSAILFQYGKIGINESGNARYNGLMRQFTDYVIKNKMDKDSFYDAIGAVQLYMYQSIEEFDFIIFTYIDKNESDKDSGKFYIYESKDFSDGKYIEKVLSKLTFKNPDSPTSTQGRTGKVFFRNLK